MKKVEEADSAKMSYSNTGSAGSKGKWATCLELNKLIFRFFVILLWQVPGK